MRTDIVRSPDTERGAHVLEVLRDRVLSKYVSEDAYPAVEAHLLAMAQSFMDQDPNLSLLFGLKLSLAVWKWQGKPVTPKANDYPMSLADARALERKTRLSATY